jgi:hypothetical protein
METLQHHPMPIPTIHQSLSSRFCGRYAKSLCFLLLAGTVVLSACGGGSSGRGSQIPVSLSGNWQFTVASPPDGSFLGGLQGGFLLQAKNSVNGSVAYSILLPPAQSGGNPTVCDSGSAPITGTVSGQSVTLTAVAGTQTFALNGTLSFDGSTMAGTYTSTVPDGSACGTVQTGLQWSATFVPQLTGPIQGNFHSSGGNAGLNGQDFLVSGALSQADSSGASTAPVTGTLNFLNSTTNLSDYPCFALASVSGQISGTSVILQIVGTDGSIWGQIGEPTGSATGATPVTFDPAQGGHILHGVGTSYLVATNTCPGNLSGITTAGDSGSICLALGGTKACQQPITLTPAALIFPAQGVRTSPTFLTTVLTNTSSSILSSLSLTIRNDSGPGNFAESDDCGLAGVPSQGQSFSLNPQQFCTITVAFSPQASCANQPEQCLIGTLMVTDFSNDTIYTLPLMGTGISGSAASTLELDLRETRAAESMLSQWPWFNKRSGHAEPSSSSRVDQDVEHHVQID